MKKVNLYDIENCLEGVDRNGRMYDTDAVKVAFAKFTEENGECKFDITHMSNLLERSKVPKCSFGSMVKE